MFFSEENPKICSRLPILFDGLTFYFLKLFLIYLLGSAQFFSFEKKVENKREL